VKRNDAPPSCRAAAVAKVEVLAAADGQKKIKYSKRTQFQIAVNKFKMNHLTHFLSKTR
jgi:hypothetical protein